MCLSSNERGIDHFGLPLAIVRDSMKGRSHTLIHISGIDSFLGKRLLAESDKAASGETDLRDIPDGMYLRNEEWDEVLAQSSILGPSVTAAPRKPALVSISTIRQLVQLHSRWPRVPALRCHLVRLETDAKSPISLSVHD